MDEHIFISGSIYPGHVFCGKCLLDFNKFRRYALSGLDEVIPLRFKSHHGK